MSNQDTEAGRFVETATSKLITSHINEICYARTVGAIVAPPGTGKSYTAQCISDSNPDALYIQATELTARTKPLLKEIGKVLKGSYYFNQHRSADDLYNELKSCLSETNYFLLIDEAQNIEASTVRLLLTLNDNPDLRIPIVFIGNRYFLRRTKAASFALDQILSRGIKDRTLEMDGASWRDVEAIAMSYGVTGLDAFDLLNQRWQAGFDLRRLTDHLKTAKRLTANGPVTRQNLEDALVSMNALGNTRGTFKIQATSNRSSKVA
jgi:DNA transposition AAA+ family ATPase